MNRQNVYHRTKRAFSPPTRCCPCNARDNRAHGWSSAIVCPHGLYQLMCVAFAWNVLFVFVLFFCILFVCSLHHITDLTRVFNTSNWGFGSSSLQARTSSRARDRLHMQWLHCFLSHLSAAYTFLCSRLFLRTDMYTTYVSTGSVFSFRVHHCASFFDVLVSRVCSLPWMCVCP